MRALFSLFFVFLLCSIVSSSGLIVSENEFNFNKTNNQDISFDFTITNSEPFDFYNISSSSEIISFSKTTILSGETKTITATISSNENFNGQIKIIGDYYSDIGVSNITENIKIDSSGLDICDIDIIKGDSIKWNNTLLGQIKLRNINTGEYFQTIDAESSYTKIFESPVSFDYQVYKVGLPFSSICHLNVNPSTGYIHNQDYDALLNINLQISFPSTTISHTFLQDNFSLNHNSQTEQIFSITNTGNNIAKNIALTGEWFSFNNNYFDLDPGETKTVSYKILPIIYQTNQTNKSYQKIISINGNFEEKQKQINIFINYKNLDTLNGDFSYDKDSIRNLLYMFCESNPNECPERLIYASESDRNVTFTVNEQTYREKILSDDKFQTDIKLSIRKQDELIAYLNESIYQIKFSNNKSNEKVENLENTTNDFLSVITFSFIGISFVFCCGILIFLIYNDKARHEIGKLFTKGELW